MSNAYTILNKVINVEMEKNAYKIFSIISLTH